LLVDATFAVIADVCERHAGGQAGDAAHVEHWLAHRNDVAALEALTTKGYTVDTMEVAAPWTALPAIYRATLDALLGVEGTLAASAHQSHSYPSGGCLYFTFAGQVDADRRDAYYRELWDAGQRAVLAHGGALSHHHGVGLNRGRYMA
jgi:alkyldihydroxyacetonephosphate synthase